MPESHRLVTWGPTVVFATHHTRHTSSSLRDCS
jgi:hypothetical protein